MKKHKKLWIVLGVLVVLIAGLTVWQWKNIQAVYLFATTSNDQIAQDIEQSKKDFQEQIAPYNSGDVKDFSFEEEQEILSGQLPLDDTLAQLKEQEQQAQEKAEAEQGNNEAQAQAYVDAALAQVYGVKATYLSELGRLKASAIEEVKALPADQRTKMNVLSIGMKYASTGYDAEDKCDASINDILATLKSNLESVGADTSVVAALRGEYEAQKKSQKAYYLSELQASVASLS